MEVGKFEGVVIVSSILLYAEGWCFREDMDGTLICLLMFEVKGNIYLLTCFDVPDFKGWFSGLEDHHLSLT